MTRVSAFAEQELGALALQPNSNHNTGLPLTDDQKARTSQIKDSDKKRAAATQDKIGKQMVDGQQKAVAAALQANQKSAKGGPGKDKGLPGPRKTPTLSGWAKPCTNREKGAWLKGISCFYKHQGFDVTEDRCSNCGTKGHRYAECTNPGGGKDPDWQKNMDAYRARKAESLGEKPGGKGSDKKKAGSRKRR